MLKFRECLYFVCKAFAEIWRPPNVRYKFNSDTPVRGNIFGEKDLTHAAFAQEFTNAIGAEVFEGRRFRVSAEYPIREIEDIVIQDVHLLSRAGGVDFRAEPGLGFMPFALNRALRDAKRRGSFIDGHS